MDAPTTPPASADLRRQLLSDSKRFFEAAHAAPAFVAGATYIPVTAKTMGADDLEHLLDASLDMWLTAGRYAHEFEAELPKKMGRKVPALLVNSGSSANLLAVSSLGAPMWKAAKAKPLEPGDEVITVAAGFPTTVNPIFQNGWVPVFVDVDLKTLNALPETVMEARGPKTRAVILAHSLGNPYRADKIAAWCKAEGLHLIEDCCDALGGTIAGQPVGSFGDYATLSFYPAHHITMGEGGAVVSRDTRFRRVAESVRDWGRDCWCDPGKDNTCGKRFEWKLGDLPEGYDHKYIYSNLGYNLKVTDMQAALGISQLKKLEGFVSARRANWRKLHDGMLSSPLLRDKLVPVEPTPETDPSWFGFPMHCRDGVDRRKVTTFLEQHKVGTRLMFGGNLTRQPAYRGTNFRVSGSLANSDKVMNSTFWIGVHPGIDAARIAYMLEQLEAAVKSL